ncbi:MAG: PhoX family phosphatase [Micropruina sp.]|uniref:PhoX family protein n=1 Tax=Micropruina sp. TaxID=2737536 RepID=UPI0039E4885D
MTGRTHGNRSAVTCHLKCDSQCARPDPNTSTEPSFAEIAGRQLTRRALLAGAGGVAAASALPLAWPQAAAATPRRGTKPLAFTPIESVGDDVDAMVVPTGYEWTPILRWGDPLFNRSPRFDPSRPNARAQELQFGYNNDYLDILVERGGRRALLCCNHEYTNRAIMFPPTSTAEQEAEVLRALIAAHGFSVVELERHAPTRPWRYIRGGRRNRRITADTPFRLTGPAAGTALLKTVADPTGRRSLGTFGNCSGGTTPWGTILSGEENFHGYFVADPDARGGKRYGMTNKPSVYGWEKVDARFDATNPGYANEPNRMGYIVEIDPYDPDSTPRKHTAMGRLKHEGANVRVDRDGTVVAYMGDDERFEYLYKFVAKRKYREGGSAAARRHNLEILTEGNLYVARFSGQQREDNDNLGTGEWVPLVFDGRSMIPGMSVAEVLVFTREAADAVKATPMDRCEDVQPHPTTGRVYVACTNNVQRGTAGKAAPDAPNPRGLNKDGHVIEITEDRNRADAATFAWNLLLVCGKPEDAGTYFAGWDGPVAPISCPDNLAFDSEGNLWVATDGAPSAISKADGLFKVPLAGPERGHVQQFLAVPIDAETCGPVIHDRDGSVFVAVQHPGEDGSWAAQRSHFPDYVPVGMRPEPGDWRGPRPTVVQVTKQR